MSEQLNDGGPAYPTSFEPLDTKDYENRKGMTLRDYFAGQALAGMNANPTIAAALPHKVIAELAFGDADAMIAERNKRNEEGEE